MLLYTRASNAWAFIYALRCWSVFNKHKFCLNKKKTKLNFFVWGEKKLNLKCCNSQARVISRGFFLLSLLSIYFLSLFHNSRSYNFWFRRDLWFAESSQVPNLIGDKNVTMKYFCYTIEKTFSDHSNIFTVTIILKFSIYPWFISNNFFISSLNM